MITDHLDDEPMEFLDQAECWHLLRTEEVGRLAVPTSYGGVDIFPVNHLVDQGTVVFRTALGSKLSLATAAREIAFEVDGADDDSAWSVVMHGRAKLISGTTEIFDTFELSVRPWHTANKPYFVRVVPSTVTGRRFHIQRSSHTPSP